MVTTQPPSPHPTQPLSFNAADRLRAPSFSSYLNSPEKSIIGKLSQDPISLFHGTKKVEEREIGVFGAEKYFHGLIMSEENQRAYSNNVDISDLKTNFHPRASCTYSESSWNSQSGLLQSVKRNPSRRKGKSFISSTLGCSCSCDGKNSDVVDEKDKETNSKRSLSSGGAFRGKMGKQESAKTGSDLARIKQSGLNQRVMEEIHRKKIDEMGNGLGREECFSFPILNSTPGGNPIPMNSQGNQEGKKQRNSWEAFGSYVLDKKKNKNFLILEGNPTTEEFEIPRSSDAMYDDDSEASSDLFEIESFTNIGNSFHRRNGSDGMSSCGVTHTNCYAPPSEVSIEWSVVTASAAEFSSVISDSEEELAANPKGLTNPRKMGSVGGKEMEKRRSGNLLGCKSYKAVRVAGDAYVRSSKKGNLDSRRTRYRSSREGKGN